MVILVGLREGLGHGSVAMWLASGRTIPAPDSPSLPQVGFILLGLLLAAKQAWLGRSTPIDRPKETLRP